MALDRRTLKRMALPFSITLEVEESSISGTTKDISRKGLCVEILTSRMPHNPCNLINKTVTLHHKNETLVGSVVWYTVEGAMFEIGIAIEQKHLPCWKKIIHPHYQLRFKSVIKHA